MTKYVWLAVGTLAGGFGRYALTAGVQRLVGPGFPYGTLLVNTTGCFVIGLAGAVASDRGLSVDARMFLMTGFCAAFTTFSTLILDSTNLMKEGHGLTSAANLFGSIAVGVMAVYLGALVAKTF